MNMNLTRQFSSLAAIGALLPLLTGCSSSPAPTVGETLPPRFPSVNWLVIPQKEIANYAKGFPVQVLDEKTYASTVSPILQEKAKAAGYTIIYQVDPTQLEGQSLRTIGKRTVKLTLFLKIKAF
jgi:hypothetical protein